jgi:Spy/CpxP family protein refolding chaperone
MKHKVKSYGEVVLEQTEVLDLTDEQLGRITRIHMTNKKIRKKLLEQPHKSMKKVFKTLRNPAADESMIRKAGARHSTDFDVLLEAELQVRKKIDAVLTPKQRTKLIAMKLPKENETSE